MNVKFSPVVAGLVGILCGIASTHFLFVGSWLSLLFWGIIGALIGFFVKEKRAVVLSGIVYGFCLSLAFLFSGFQGAPDKFFGFAKFSLLLSVVGAGGGLVSALIGSWIKKRC